MHRLCTIITATHLPYAEVLFDSFKRFHSDAEMDVLVIDQRIKSQFGKITLHHVDDIAYLDGVQELLLQHATNSTNALRWSLKPIFLLWLLEKFETVVYADSDLFFTGNLGFVFELLTIHSILLTPHWGYFSPLPYTADFELNFRIGLYNAGFIAVSREAKKPLAWWGNACRFKVAKDVENGYFDDQRYLDLIPVIDEKAAIIRHPGCNIGGWNIHQNKRSIRNGQVLINDKYPVVFIHFNQSTLEQIASGNDSILQPYLDLYKSRFQKLGYSYDVLRPGIWSHKPALAKQLKRKLRLRTRLKMFLFKLYQSV